MSWQYVCLKFSTPQTKEGGRVSNHLSQNKTKQKGARMGHRSEVKCSSRKGKILSSSLSREEKGEREGREERERETGRGKMYSPFLFKAHIKKIELPSKFTATPQYYLYYSS